MPPPATRWTLTIQRRDACPQSDYVTVSFDAAASGSLPAISVPGYVEYVGTDQINVFVPWELEGYPSAQMKEIYDGIPSRFQNVLTVPLAE